jgi:hypothetical protein
LAKRAKAVQQAPGEHQDAVVATSSSALHPAPNSPPSRSMSADPHHGCPERQTVAKQKSPSRSRQAEHVVPGQRSIGTANTMPRRTGSSRELVGRSPARHRAPCPVGSARRSRHPRPGSSHGKPTQWEGQVARWQSGSSPWTSAGVDCLCRIRGEVSEEAAFVLVTALDPSPGGCSTEGLSRPPAPPGSTTAALRS